MGKTYSQPIYTFSQQLDQHLYTHLDEYRKANHSTKRMFRQEAIRAYGNSGVAHKDRLDFVRPVLEFIPRSVILRHPKIQNSLSISDPKIVYKLSEELPLPEQQTVRKRIRPNKRRRAAKRRNERLRAWRESPDVAITRPLPQSMIRRLRLMNTIVAMEFFTAVLATVTSSMQLVRDVVHYLYVLATSDSDLHLLARVTGYLANSRRQDGEAISRLFKKLTEDIDFRLRSFIYVVIYRQNRLRSISFYDFEVTVRTFLAAEGLHDSWRSCDDRRSNLEFFESVETGHLKMAYDLEGERFIDLLKKALMPEIIRIRGIRLFRNVTDTVLAIPVVRLFAGVSRMPSRFVDFGETLTTLVTPIDQRIYRVDENSESYLTFIRDMSHSVDIDVALSSAERALYNRRYLNNQDTDSESRFQEEPDEEAEASNSRGSGNV